MHGAWNMEKGGRCSSVHQLHPLTLPIPNLHQRRRKRHPLPEPLLRTHLRPPRQIRLRPDQRPRPRRLANADTPRNPYRRPLRTATYNLRLPLAVRASNDRLFGCGLLEGFRGKRGREEHLQVLQRRGDFEGCVGGVR